MHVNRALVSEVAAHCPLGTCTLLADQGLACLELIRICQEVKWHYVLRISQEHQVRRQYKRGYSLWQGGGQFVTREGQQWYGAALIWKEHSFAASLAVCWEPG